MSPNPVVADIPLLTILEQAARMSGFLKAAGRGLSGSEQQEMLHICNATLDGLKQERLFFYQMRRNQMAVQANQQEYLVGPGQFNPNNGTTYWEIERPEKIYGAGFLVPTSPPGLVAEVPMDVVLDYIQWKNIVTKEVTSSQPRAMYYLPLADETGGNTGKAILWPLPYDNSNLVIYTPGYVDEFSDVTQTIIFPKGYRIFLEYELAVAAHDRYPQNPWDPNIQIRAKEYKSRVMAAQLTPSLIMSDPAVNQRPTLPALRWWDCRSWPGGY